MLPSWVPKPVSGFKFAAKIALHHEVSQLVCDVNQLVGFFTAGLTNGGLTIGLFTGKVTLSELDFSCVILKYGLMCSHRKIFEVRLEIFHYYMRKD